MELQLRSAWLFIQVGARDPNLGLHAHTASTFIFLGQSYYLVWGLLFTCLVSVYVCVLFCCSRQRTQGLPRTLPLTSQ